MFPLMATATMLPKQVFCSGIFAGVAKLADAPDLGSGMVTCAGSSPVSGTQEIT